MLLEKENKVVIYVEEDCILTRKETSANMLGGTNNNDTNYHFQFSLKGVFCLPLTMLPVGKEALVNACRAKNATKKFLEGLGIISGASISVVWK